MPLFQIHTVRLLQRICAIALVTTLGTTSRAETPTGRSAGDEKAPRESRGGAQIWVGVFSGLGELHNLDAFGDGGRFTALSFGGSAGIGGFVGSHLQLGAELVAEEHQALHRLGSFREHPEKSTQESSFDLWGLGLRATGYLGQREGIFVSGVLKGGVGHGLVGAYSLELGYAGIGWIGGGRTGVALGYERANAVSNWVSDVDEYNDSQVFLTLRVEVTD